MGLRHGATRTSVEKAPYSSYPLDRYGHFGSPDQVLSLGLAERQRILREGDVVVFASAGLGYMWAAQSFVWNRPTFAPAALAALG